MLWINVELIPALYIIIILINIIKSTCIIYIKAYNIVKECNHEVIHVSIAIGSLTIKYKYLNTLITLLLYSVIMEFKDSRRL